MTRLERKELELDKLYGYRSAAIRNNDLIWLSANQKKIDELEKEIIEMKKYEPMKLSEALNEYGTEAKNEVYRHLLRVSLLSDVVTEALMECRKCLDKYGLREYTYRHDVAEMDRLSKKIANIVLIAGNYALEDFIVDNGEMMDVCLDAADKHIREKLRL